MQDLPACRIYWHAGSIGSNNLQYDASVAKGVTQDIRTAALGGRRRKASELRVGS